MIPKILKLWHNTKAILKIDDKPTKGSNNLVTSGGVYNSIAESYSFDIYYTIPVDDEEIPGDPVPTVRNLDINSVVDTALEGKNIILKSNQGDIFYLTCVDKDTPVMTYLYFISLQNGVIKQLKASRENGVCAAELTVFNLS